MPRGQPRVPAGFRTGGQFTKSNVAKRPSTPKEAFTRLTEDREEKLTDAAAETSSYDTLLDRAFDVLDGSISEKDLEQHPSALSATVAAENFTGYRLSPKDRQQFARGLAQLALDEARFLGSTDD